MKTPGHRGHRGLGPVVGAALGLLAPHSRAEAPARVACTVTRTGARVVVRPEALALVAPELERLMKLGLAGRLEVELRLLRPRRWWLAEELETVTLTQVLAYSGKAGGWLLDGRPLEAGPGALALERVAWTLEEAPAQEATFVVEVGVRLQVVTTASLGKVAQWLTRGEQTEEERSALKRGLLRTVTEDLTRRAEGRCTTPGPP